MFFSEEKNQKTFVHAPAESWRTTPEARDCTKKIKVFFLRFPKNPVFFLRRGAPLILLGSMRKAGFLKADDLRVLEELARDGLAEHRLARRANALILLDRGMSCIEVAQVLLLDDDTIRRGGELFGTEG